MILKLVYVVFFDKKFKQVICNSVQFTVAKKGF